MQCVSTTSFFLNDQYPILHDLYTSTRQYGGFSKLKACLQTVSPWPRNGFSCTSQLSLCKLTQFCDVCSARDEHEHVEAFGVYWCVCRGFQSGKIRIPWSSNFQGEKISYENKPKHVRKLNAAFNSVYFKKRKEETRFFRVKGICAKINEQFRWVTHDRSWGLLQRDKPKADYREWPCRICHTQRVIIPFLYASCCFSPYCRDHALPIRILV